MERKDLLQQISFGAPAGRSVVGASRVRGRGQPRLDWVACASTRKRGIVLPCSEGAAMERRARHAINRHSGNPANRKPSANMA
jgi:hypothetical protein